jgi:Predicted membrane protein/domain
MSDGIEPGWYPDPVDKSVQRYWDGEQWVGRPIPADATPPVTPPPPEPPAPSSAPPAGPSPVPAKAQPPSEFSPPVAVQDMRLGTQTLVYGKPLAPLSARFMARFVDTLALVGLNAFVNGWFIYQWWREMAPVYAETQRYLLGQVAEQPMPTERASSLQWAIMLIGLGLWFAYEVPAVASTGQTLGKRLFQVKVIRYDGADPGFRAAFGRWLFLSSPMLLLICLAPLLVANLLWCTWDRPLRQCLHDKFGRTVVVQADRAAAPTETRDQADTAPRS